MGVAQDEGEEQPGRDKAVELWNARAEQHQSEQVASMPIERCYDVRAQCPLTDAQGLPIVSEETGVPEVGCMEYVTVRTAE